MCGMTKELSTTQLDILAADKLDQFISAWESAKDPPELADYLSPELESVDFYLVELIKCDLEYRWVVFNFPKRLPAYICEIKNLKNENISFDLVETEINYLAENGFSIDKDEYVATYPHLEKEIEACLNPLYAEQQSAAETPTVIGGAEEPTHLFRSTIDPSQIKPGEQVDDFDLLVELGKGAFATVYLARQISMQRLVALKISEASGEEPQTLAQLDHPHIVRVFDQRTFPEQRIRLMYMEYLAGGTIEDITSKVFAMPKEKRNGKAYLDAIAQELIKRGESRPGQSALTEEISRMDWKELVCWIGMRLSNALEYAESKGVLHRDIKPANILCSSEGTPKLADFNISFSSEVEGGSAEANFGGSLMYMSPEQLEAFHPGFERRAGDLNGKSDQYTLGLVLWEMLTGSRPFPQIKVPDNRIKLLDRMLEQRKAGVPTKTVAIAKEMYPPAIVDVLLKMLSPARSARFATAKEIARQFEYCRNRDFNAYLYEYKPTWVSRYMPYITMVLLICYFIPNLMAGVFNYLYNVEEIVSPYLFKMRNEFEFVQLVINAIAYPIGIGIGWYLIWCVSNAIKEKPSAAESTVTAETARRSRHLALNLGLYLSVVALIEWIIAGIMYPVSVRIVAGQLPWHAYVHFFGSLLLSGLLAVSYTYFICTYIGIEYIYPRILRKKLDLDLDKKERKALSRTLFLYLLFAMSLPLAAVGVMAIVTGSTLSRIYLAALSMGSFFGCGVILFCYKEIKYRLDLLDSIDRIHD